MALFKSSRGKEEGAQNSSGKSGIPVLKKFLELFKYPVAKDAVSQETMPQNTQTGCIQNIDNPVQGELLKVPKTTEPRTIIVSSNGSANEEIPAQNKQHIKLRIFLIENTKEMEMEKQNISLIFKRFLDSSFIIINYGSIVRKSDIMASSDFDLSKLFEIEDLGDNSCLYNALIELENIVEENYHKFKQEEDVEIYVDSIDIIGIGTGVDNFSTNSEKLAIESFAKTANLEKVTTRYFCLGEQNVVNPAIIGFRSIGSIPPKM